MDKATQADKAMMFFTECLQTLLKKANDYADDQDKFSNFKKIATVCEIPVEKTFIMFMTVKLARIVELMKKDAQVAESTSDSLVDIVNYACLMSIYLKEKGA